MFYILIKIFISKNIAQNIEGYIIYIRRVNNLIAVHHTPMDIFLFLFSVWSFYAARPSKGFSTVCGDVIRGKKSGTSGLILATTRSIWSHDSSGVLLFRALLPCLTVKWPFRRSVRSIGCRSSCRCGRRRRQTWFSGICDTWRSAQPRPFCVSPNAFVSFLRGPAPRLAFVYKQITDC